MPYHGRNFLSFSDEDGRIFLSQRNFVHDFSLKISSKKIVKNFFSKFRKEKFKEEPQKTFQKKKISEGPKKKVVRRTLFRKSFFFLNFSEERKFSHSRRKNLVIAPLEYQNFSS